MAMDTYSGVTDEWRRVQASNGPYLKNGEAGNSLWQLSCLVEIEFPKHIDMIPAWVSNLVDLKCLNLSFCEQLAGNLYSVPLLPLMERAKGLIRIECEGCIKVTNPPQEICAQGGLVRGQAVAKFFGLLGTEWEMSKTLTLFLLGDGEAGKTSVLLALKSVDGKAHHIRADHRTVGLM